MSSIEAIIDRQIRRWELEKALEESRAAAERPAVCTQPVLTVSRQRGAGGGVIARKLAERFNYTLLHRDIIDKLCASTGMKRRLVESLDEHSRSQMAVWFEAIIGGKYVDEGEYAHHLMQIIYSMSRLGGVVVVGRGANFIVGPERGFHIRVVAPVEVRVRNLMKFDGLAESTARVETERSDQQRADFVRKLFGKSIDDPLQYDLVVNDVSISPETAVSLIAVAAMEKFERLRGNRQAGTG